jgi:hypothetical protein
VITDPPFLCLNRSQLSVVISSIYVFGVLTRGAAAGPVIMREAEVVANGVGHVAGEDVGLEGVDVHADAHRADGADSAHVGDGRLA